MYKVMTVVGTRPELIKLSQVIQELDIYTRHIFVHTGQNYDYELNEIFFKDLGIRKPDYFLGIVNHNAVGAIAEVLVKVEEVIQKEKPDAFLIYGDTNSCLSALVAKRYKVPIFHMEAGNRCFDERVPEEVNRKILDHISDINMTLTEHSRRYLLAEGIRGDRIIKLGSCMKEVLFAQKEKINNTTILEQLNLKKQSYLVVSIHREENVDSDLNIKIILQTLNKLIEVFDKDIIFSLHPRTRKKIEQLKIDMTNPRIKFMKPLSFTDYIGLQKNAFCTLSDSGTITEEASLLEYPAITLRNAHERPEGMDEGILIMTGIDEENIVDAVRTVTSQQQEGKKLGKVKDYEVEEVAAKMVRIILSYTGYINRDVWHKEGKL